MMACAILDQKIWIKNKSYSRKKKIIKWTKGHSLGKEKGKRKKKTYTTLAKVFLSLVVKRKKQLEIYF